MKASGSESKSSVLASRTTGKCTVAAVLGDITEAAVDAVVNAANCHLAHGGGLAGAIVRRGGAVIQRESDHLAPVAVGKAVATGAGSLPAKWVIHAVGPRWGEGDEENKLRSAVRSSLACASELGATTVALPAISTGIFGYPKAAGTRDIVDEVDRWLASNPCGALELVNLTAFDPPTAELFAAAVAPSG